MAARSKARVPGFGRVTGFDRVGWFNSLKKIQNDVVLVKKNKKTKVNGFVTESWPGQPGHQVNSPGHTWFFLPFFFVNPARFRSRIDRVPNRPAEPGRVSKLSFQELYKKIVRTGTTGTEWVRSVKCQIKKKGENEVEKSREILVAIALDSFRAIVLSVFVSTVP